MKKFITLSASLVLLLASSAASARLIDGVINFTGGAVVDFDSTQVNSVDFYDTATVNVTDNLTTGDFEGLEGAPASFFDILDTSNVVSTFLWAVDSFVFEITSLDTNSVFDVPGLTLTNIAGTGTIYSSDPNLDPTSGTWSVTTNGASQEMSFSSTAVPAPAGAALLGLGLLGFGFARRNKKA